MNNYYVASFINRDLSVNATYVKALFATGNFDSRVIKDRRGYGDIVEWFINEMRRIGCLLVWKEDSLMKNEHISDDERQRIIAYEDRVLQKITQHVEPWVPKFHVENFELVVEMYWSDSWARGPSSLPDRPDFFNGYMAWVEVSVRRDGKVVELSSEGEWNRLAEWWNVGNMIAEWGFILMFKKRKANPAYVYCWSNDIIDELTEFLQTSLISVKQ